MTILQDYIRQLGNSEPIFQLSLTNGGTRIDRRLVNRYVPKAAAGDPISEIVCRSYQESFHNVAYRKNEREMQRAVIDDVRRQFRQFIENYGGFKNARQSSIYRFMATSSYNIIDEHSDGLIMLYRYARERGMQSHGATMIAGPDRDNVLAIIEAMRTKYE